MEFLTLKEVEHVAFFTLAREGTSESNQRFSGGVSRRGLIPAVEAEPVFLGEEGKFFDGL